MMDETNDRSPTRPPPHGKHLSLDTDPVTAAVLAVLWLVVFAVAIVFLARLVSRGIPQYRQPVPLTRNLPHWFSWDYLVLPFECLLLWGCLSVMRSSVASKRWKVTAGIFGVDFVLSILATLFTLPAALLSLERWLSIFIEAVALAYALIAIPLWFRSVTYRV